MKFQIKLFITTIIVVSLGFCAGGSLLVTRNFNHTLETQIDRAAAKHDTIIYFYEFQLSDILSETAKLTNQELAQAVNHVFLNFNSLFIDGLTLCISDVDKNHVFTNLPTGIGRAEIIDTFVSGTQNSHRKIVKSGERYLLIITTHCEMESAEYFITTVTDITVVYDELAVQTRNMLITNAVTLGVLGVVLFLLSAFITRPIKALSKSAERIAAGNYNEQVIIHGNDEVAVLADKFNLMSESIARNIQRLEEYGKSRDTFVANFSHEMKTPMTSIIGYAEILCGQCDEDTRTESAAYIRSEGKRLEALSQRLLTLLKLKQSELKLLPTPIAPLIDEVIISTRPICTKSGVTLTVSEYPKSAAFDKDLIETLLINLINNACNADSQNVIINFEQIDGKCRVSVSDNGCGIPKDDLTKITDEFYRADKSRKNTGDNFGLGLTICKEIARLHTSELIIESEQEKGTTVTFYLGVKS